MEKIVNFMNKMLVLISQIMSMVKEKVSTYGMPKVSRVFKLMKTKNDTLTNENK